MTLNVVMCPAICNFCHELSQILVDVSDLLAPMRANANSSKNLCEKYNRKLDRFGGLIAFKGWRHYNKEEMQTHRVVVLGMSHSMPYLDSR